jgi:hypothetical protein
MDRVGHIDGEKHGAGDGASEALGFSSFESRDGTLEHSREKRSRGSLGASTTDFFVVEQHQHAGERRCGS